VWLTGQRPSRDQRRGRYTPQSIFHPGKMLPSIAAHAIAAYTRPGELVADPMCGIGTTLVEAIHAGRHGVGVEYERRWSDLAVANLRHAAAHGASGTATVWHADGRTLPDLLTASQRGRVALVITSPPYGPSTHGRAYLGAGRNGRQIAKAHHRYGHDRDNLAYAGADELAAGFSDILRGCAAVLRPGGTVVITARPYRRHGDLIDIPGMVLAAGRAAGLHPVERCVALLAGVRDGRLIPRGSFFQMNNIRQAGTAGPSQALISFEDVLIFRLPEAT
jgi:tRNA G10  N-methylase Trm11